MTKLIGKSYHAVGIGIITGIIIFSMSLLFKQEAPLELTVTETVIEVEVLEQLIQETDCVEIIEYDMSTGMKTTVGCIAKEST